MLNSLNNDKYYSKNKKRKIKKSNSNDICILPINNYLNNYINPKDKDNIKYSFYRDKKRFSKNNLNNKDSNCSNKKVFQTLDVDIFCPKNKHKQKVVKKDNIMEIEKCLAQSKKKFKRNVSQKIIRNKKFNEKLIDNINILNGELNDNYKELLKSKYNFYLSNKNTIETIFDEERLRLEKRSNNNKINDLKNNIKYIQSKIHKIKMQTNLYETNYMNIKNEFDNLKNQCKTLPNVIEKLEIDNRNLVNEQITFQSYIQKTKLKLLELENNKKTIIKYLKQINILYN